MKKRRNYSIFVEQGNLCEFTQDAVRKVYESLFCKMVNLRKIDMEKSWERIETQKHGSSVTLNLRDELKVFAAKKT